MDQARPMSPSEVELDIPASPELLRVARLTAASLAGRLQFSYEEIEDVKIAVDELCFALVGTKGRPGRLTLRYQLDDESLTILGTGAFEGPVADPVPSDLSRQILSAVVDGYDLDRDGDTLRFRLVKRRSTEQ
jgi:serine/threonine-protein kinase RsbW